MPKKFSGLPRGDGRGSKLYVAFFVSSLYSCASGRLKSTGMTLSTRMCSRRISFIRTATFHKAPGSPWCTNGALLYFGTETDVQNFQLHTHLQPLSLALSKACTQINTHMECIMHACHRQNRFNT